MLNNFYKLLIALGACALAYAYGHYRGYQLAKTECQAKNDNAIIANQTKQISILTFNNKTANQNVNAYESELLLLRKKYETAINHPVTNSYRVRNVPTTCSTTMPSVPDATSGIDATAERCTESFIFKCQANSTQLGYLQKYINEMSLNWNATYK
jgi:hypothetical protein